MKYIYIILFFVAINHLWASGRFYLVPVSLNFPAVKLTINGPEKKICRKEFACLGNFSETPTIIKPAKPVSYETPFSVLEHLLYIFQYSIDFNEIKNLISPNLTEEERNFYLSQISLPEFKATVRKIKTYAVYGYFLDKNTCVVFYAISTEKGNSCSQFVFVFENGRWYLGDQMGNISENLMALSSFLSFFPKDIKTDLKIKTPPSVENLAVLASDLETIYFYNKLSKFYKLIPFNKFIENRLNE